MTCPWQLLAANKAQLSGCCMMQVQMIMNRGMPTRQWRQHPAGEYVQVLSYALWLGSALQAVRLATSLSAAGETQLYAAVAAFQALQHQATGCKHFRAAGCPAAFPAGKGTTPTLKSSQRAMSMQRHGRGCRPLQAETGRASGVLAADAALIGGTMI